MLKSHIGLVPCGLGRAISNKVHDGIDVQAFMLLIGYAVSQGYVVEARVLPGLGRRL